MMMEKLIINNILVVTRWLIFEDYVYTKDDYLDEEQQQQQH